MSLRLLQVALATSTLFSTYLNAAAAPPNVLLILADDLGISDLHAYGRLDHHTPHLDQLAKDGIRFTSAYVAQPICSASRAAILTGKHPARLHLTNYLPGRPDAPSQKLIQPVIEGQLPLEEQTLAELLRKNGYATGMFGKWHLGGEGFGPAEQGFDVATLFPENASPASPAGGKNERAITQAAQQFITKHQKAPFFCYVAHHSPHIRLAETPERVAKFDQTFNPTYAAMIESLDESVGELIATVDSLGLRDNTLIIFTSDNGGLHVFESPGTPATSNQPFRAGKGYLYEGGLRVPLIIRWPAIVKPNQSVDIPMTLTDLTPTILQSAGINPAKAVGPLDGQPITLSEPSRRPAQPLYWHFPHYTNQGSRPAAAIRKDHWKLVEQLEDHSIELFDLSTDSGETKNLVADQPKIAQELTEQLHAWQKRIAAQQPTADPTFDPLLHQSLYITVDPSKLVPLTSAALTATHWQDWRSSLSSVVRGRQARLTPRQGDVRLLARDAVVHAQTMRYEKEPFKDVLGYWTNPADWAEWTFSIPASGRYEVEVQVGCGTGSGGAKVQIEVSNQTLEWTVIETGHFQSMILQTIGEVELSSGNHRLAVRPKTKPGPAVMDLRRIVLRPIEKRSDPSK
jgi:arylsulfatase A-like enzyme